MNPTKIARTIFLSTVLLCIPVAIVSSGCATAQQSARVQTAAKLAAYVGVKDYLRTHTDIETRAKVVEVRERLRELSQSEHLDLPTLLAIIQRLPIKELKSEQATIIVTSATILLSDYAGNLPVDKLDELKTVAKAIGEGLELALGN